MEKLQTKIAVKKLLEIAYGEAKTILRNHRAKLDLVAETLLERETLDGKSFRRLLAATSKTPTDRIQGEEGEASADLPTPAPAAATV